MRAEIRREMETNFDYENWYRHIGFDWDRVVLGEMRQQPYSDHSGKSLLAVARALSRLTNGFVRPPGL